MRLIGYILLLTGFLWLVVWCAPSSRSLLRNIGIEHFKKYSAARTYSNDEVCEAIRSVIAEYWENEHGIVLPATLMLAGGVVLNFSGRRKATRPIVQKSNPSP